MLKRVDRIWAVLNGGFFSWRRLAGFGLAYLLFFASIVSVAHTAHAKGASLDPFHAIICSDGGGETSAPQLPASHGPDQDFSCCTLGFVPHALLPASGFGFVAPPLFTLNSNIFPAFQTREGYPRSAPGMSRAPPFRA